MVSTEKGLVTWSAATKTLGVMGLGKFVLYYFVFMIYKHVLTFSHELGSK